MTRDDLYDALKHIESLDPDGGTVEPTEAAHAAHRAWAVDMYGEDVWRRYRASGWDDPEV